MSRVNRGKDFENQVRVAFESVENVSVDRLVDQMSGFVGSANICDFIVYKEPYEYYIECKSCYGNTLSIHSNDTKRMYGAISNTQWNGLLEKSRIKGCIAGILVWFIDWDKTIFMPIQSLKILRDAGAKSINLNHMWDTSWIEIDAKKRRVLFDYDMESFFRRTKHNYEHNYKG